MNNEFYEYVEDVAICLYSLAESYEETDAYTYIDCIPTAMLALHRIAQSLDIDIKWDIIAKKLNSARPAIRYTVDEAERIIAMLREALYHRNIDVVENLVYEIYTSLAKSIEALTTVEVGVHTEGEVVQSVEVTIS